MKLTWPLRFLLVLCLVLPLAYSKQTFDHFGVPKMALFLWLGVLLLFTVIMAHRRLPNIPKVIWLAVGLFLGMQFFQTFRLSDIMDGIFGAYGQSESLLVQTIFIALFFAGYLWVEDNASQTRLAEVCFLATCLVSVYAISQYYGPDPITRTIMVARVNSYFGDPNSLAIFLVLVSPLNFWLFSFQPSKIRRLLVGAGIFSSMVALTLTFSRAGWLGFVLSLCLYMICTLRFTSLKNKKQFITVLVVIIIAGLTIGTILPHFQIKQKSRDYNVTTRVVSISQGKDSGRSIIWSTAWEVFQHSPIIGYGLGSFIDTFHQYQTQAASRFWNPDRDLREAHNEFLQYLATQGILGFAIFLGLLIAVFWKARWVNIFQADAQLASISLWSGITGYLVCMFFAYPLVHYSYLFWIFMGVLLRHQYPTPPVAPKIYRWKTPALIGIALFLCGWAVLLFNMNQADILYNKALSQSRHKLYPRALVSYRQINHLTPWVYHYKDRFVMTLIQAASWDEFHSHHVQAQADLHEAQALGSQLIHSFPNRYEPYELMGEIAFAQNKLSDAANFYRAAITRYPNNYKLYFHLAQSQYLQGQSTVAAATLQKGIAINPPAMQSFIQAQGLVFKFSH